MGTLVQVLLPSLPIHSTMAPPPLLLLLLLPIISTSNIVLDAGGLKLPLIHLTKNVMDRTNLPLTISVLTNLLPLLPLLLLTTVNVLLWVLVVGRGMGRRRVGRREEREEEREARRTACSLLLRSLAHRPDSQVEEEVR